MPLNPDDPRVKKTRRGLREAFITLILKKGYDDISIQEIAEEAETARITFYRHYRDKEELLTDCLNTLYEELVEKTGQVTPEEIRSGYSPIHVFYQHLEEQEELYRILFSSRGTQTVVERLRHHMAIRVMEAIQNFNPAEPADIPLEIIAYHTASAQIGLGIWWLDHDKPYSVEYMSRIALWLNLGGMLRAIGIEAFPIPVPQRE